MQGDAITQVGVELDPAPKHQWRSRFAFLLPWVWWNNSGLRTLRHSLSEIERPWE
jgi:hypothetical protein